MNTLTLNKSRGMTPLQAIDLLKKNRPELANEKISYAGRLDPMAQGLLLLLLGEENKNRHQYENFDKEYEFSVLFGVNTDTYDVLGRITDYKNTSTNIIKGLKEVIPEFIGEHLQAYPPYSSKTIDGKPMYYWARNNLLKDKTIPLNKIVISNLEFLKERTIAKEDLFKEIILDIKNVIGDFRQEEIVDDWRRWLEANTQGEFTIITLRASVTSGTYIRSLAQEIGKRLSTPALAYSIIRTRVGKHTLDNAITF